MMKRILRLISGLLTFVIFIQSTTLADASIVLVQKVAGENVETVYEGKIENYDALKPQFGDNRFGIIFNWDDESYYQIIPKALNNKSKVSAAPSVRNDNTDNIKDIDLNVQYPIRTIEFPEINISGGIETIDAEYNDEANRNTPELVSDISQDIKKSRAADDITATMFNTIIAPSAVNGINEPRFSSEEKMSEDVSAYSGELTMRFNDLSLPGRNGLNLDIGRIYQTSQAAIGQMKYMGVPTNGQGVQTAVLWSPQNYYLDRYNLGAGWAFSFPSVQVETEYEYDLDEDFKPFLYENTELYYHTGNGDVYQVEFTSNSEDSNLKNYYNKDIEFNQNDAGYSNGQKTSFYSMTLSDGTKQYFAKSGELLGIKDRFGNEIKFEHTLMPIANYVPNGSFAYDNDMWERSNELDFWYCDDFGRYDSSSIKFDKYVSDRAYLRSQPIQVEPNTEYQLSLSLNSRNNDEVKVEVEEYDWNYTWYNTDRKVVKNLPHEEWTEKSFTITPGYFTRYIRIRIEVEGGAKDLYIDNVGWDSPKPLISKITDTIGRTAEFSYNGNILEKGLGNVTVDITVPDGESKQLKYDKSVVESQTMFVGEEDERLSWQLDSADTEQEMGSNGKSMSKAYYRYGGGKDSSGEYVKLYSCYNSKSQNARTNYYNKPVLDRIKYRNRTIVFEYEPTRKNLGSRGFYDSLRITKRYEEEAFQNNSSAVSYSGELNKKTYSYRGEYNGNVYNDETGYPDYEFTENSAFGEKWTSVVEENGLKTENIFTNGRLVKSNVSDQNSDTVIATKYDYHSQFKNNPILITETISNGSGSRASYIKKDYNDWGGLKSETKRITSDILNNSELLDKYTSYYEYENKLPCEKRYYNNANGDELSELIEYDSFGRMISNTDAAGKKTEYFYQSSEYPGNITKEEVKDPQGLHDLIGTSRTIEYAYDQHGLFIKESKENYDGKEKCISYNYDYIYGNLKSQVNPDGGIVSNIYDEQGRVIQTSYPLVQDNGSAFYYIDRYTYRPQAKFTTYGSGIYQLEEVSRYAYYSQTESLSVCSATQNLYDNAGNLRMKGEVDFSKPTDGGYPLKLTLYYYDAYDRVIKMTDCNGNSTEFVYDSFDRTKSIKTPDNAEFVYEYDDLEMSVLSYLAALDGKAQNHIRQKFDIWDNVISREAYPNGIDNNSISENFEYDIAGNVVSKTDPNGNITKYIYDGLNRLTGTIQADGTYTRATYNYFDKPVSEKIYDTDESNKYARTSFSNEKGDIAGKFYAWDNALKYVNSYDYSAKGNAEASYEGEYLYKYAYDYMDNLLSQKSENASIERRFGKFGINIAAASDESITSIQFGYDAVGRISQKVQSNFSDIASFSYTDKNLMKKVTSPSGMSTEYSYDENDRILTVTAENNSYSYDYYDSGMLKSISYPNGIVTEYTYDNAGRIKTIITKKGQDVINNLSYTHDNNGNILTETKNGRTVTYTYDSLNRLKSADYGDGNVVTYTYDTSNNRTGEAFADGTNKEYVYDGYNRLKEIRVNGEITDTYEYNLSGSLTKHNDTIFTYDQWGRLLCSSENGNKTSFIYDANGIRTEKTGIKYFTDLNDNIITECSSDGNETSEIVYGSQALARKSDGAWYYYIYNAHGDVIGMTDSNGNLVNSYEYDAWGNVLSKSETVENPIRYAGQYYDEELGFYYLRARYYDPTIGRFTSIDALEGDISNPMDMNQYVYCRNNPVYYADYDGDAAFAISAALYLTGFALVAIGGRYVFKKLQDLSQDVLNQIYSTQAYKKAINSKLSKEINWRVNSNKKNHILKGSKNRSTTNHQDIWKKFNIDPNNSNDWKKLLPILKEVVDAGRKYGQQNVYDGKGNLTGEKFRYVKEYWDKGLKVIVEFYVNLKGNAEISDAWGYFL